METRSKPNAKKKGRPENLQRGKKKGEPPSRKLSEQKVKEFCLYYLTHGESIKSAGLHIGLSQTYVYEFFRKPLVQLLLQRVREELDVKLLEDAVKRHVCDRQFLDEKLAPIIANPHPHPKRGFSDQVAAARLAAEISGLTGGPKQQGSILNTQIIQTSILGSDVYMPEIDRQRLGIHDPRSSEIERKLLGPNREEAPSVGAKDSRTDEGTE